MCLTQRLCPLPHCLKVLDPFGHTCFISHQEALHPSHFLLDHSTSTSNSPSSALPPLFLPSSLSLQREGLQWLQALTSVGSQALAQNYPLSSSSWPPTSSLKPRLFPLVHHPSVMVQVGNLEIIDHFVFSSWTSDTLVEFINYTPNNKYLSSFSLYHQCPDPITNIFSYVATVATIYCFSMLAHWNPIIYPMAKWTFKREIQPMANC